MENEKFVTIIGAGLAGLSAAITLARREVKCNLVSIQPSERAQSVLAEGGINAALNTMGEDDTTTQHFEDTMKGGCNLESEKAVKYLVENAPRIVNELYRLGVPFNAEKGRIILRNFGGQKKKRTAYAKSSTGKIIMTALIDEARKYEVKGLITRYPCHEVVDFETEDGKIIGVKVRNCHTHEAIAFKGQIILCSGGLNGLFDGYTTGTTQNSGNVTALAFAHGIELSDLEFVQYHPTTAKISDKIMLVSEAARGEGGRLFVMRNGEKWYFMEEKYPVLKNLMPRDVVSRECYKVVREPDCENQVYLDMTGLNASIWRDKLSDLRDEIRFYLHIDPKNTPVPVAPGIHFFMGGIRVDNTHRTSARGVYAAGECAAIYHGANRLGGNSMLGAIVGGERAALSAIEDINGFDSGVEKSKEICSTCESVKTSLKMRDVLINGLGIVRNERDMKTALDGIDELLGEDNNYIDSARLNLAKAMVLSAIERKESRGSHTREDYPETLDKFKKKSVVKFDGKDINVEFVSSEDENE